MDLKFVPSVNVDNVVYVYDTRADGAMGFAAITAHDDGTVSVSVAAEVTVYRDGVELKD